MLKTAQRLLEQDRLSPEQRAELATGALYVDEWRSRGRYLFEILSLRAEKVDRLSDQLRVLDSRASSLALSEMLHLYARVWSILRAGDARIAQDQAHSDPAMADADLAGDITVDE